MNNSRAIKSKSFLNGINEININGENQKALDLKNTLLIGLDNIGEGIEGTDGLDIIDTTRKILQVFGENELIEILNEKNISKITTEMLLNENIEKQLLYITVFANMVSKKVYDKHIKELQRQNKILKNENKKIKTEYETKLEKAIDDEIKAKDEVNKTKRKHDKEIRILEHEIKRLNKIIND